LAINHPPPLALTSKQPLLEISNATARVLQIALQGLRTLFGTFYLALQTPAVVGFLLRQAHRRTVMQPPPVPPPPAGGVMLTRVISSAPNKSKSLL